MKIMHIVYEMEFFIQAKTAFSVSREVWRVAKADKKLRGEKPVLQHVSDAGLLSKQNFFCT